jgi:hypothetical protein
VVLAARGRPEPSAIAMSFVPLPRLVFSTPAPLFRGYESTVDEALAQVQPAAFLEVSSERFQHSLVCAVAHPRLEATVAGLVRGIPLR